MKKTAKLIILALAIVLTGFFWAVSSVRIFAQDNGASGATYQEAQGQYQKEIDFYKLARQEFLGAKAKYQKSKNAANQKELEEKTKVFLGKAISSLAKKLEALEIWVSAKNSLAESDKQAIVAEIKKEIDWLDEQSAKTAGANPDEIKKEAKTIQQYWKNHRLYIKKIIGEIRAARINFVIKKAENYYAEFKTKIDKLKISGKSTAQIEALMMEFNRKIGLAEDELNAAKNKFESIKSEAGTDFVQDLKEADSLFKEGNQLISESKNYIKKADDQLKQIVSEIKKAGKNIEAPQP